MLKEPEELKKFIEDTGVKPDEIYTGNSKKIRWSCSKGCSFVTTWKVLQRKKGCVICNDNRRLTYEQIVESLQEINSQLKTKKVDYKNSYNQKLDIVCPNNHSIQKTYKAYKKHGCSICNPKKEKYDINELKEIAKQRGDTILSNQYIDAHTPLLIKCNNPTHKPYLSLWTTYNRNNVRSNGFIDKTQCRKCAYENIKKNFTFVKSKIEEQNYTVLDKSNIRIDSKHGIRVQCPEKHDPYITTWNRWSNGNERCPQCANNALKTTEDIKNILSVYGLTVSDDYIYTGNKNPIKATCRHGHTTWKLLQGFIRYGCSECSSNGKSNAELWLCEYFKKYNPLHRHKVLIPNHFKTNNNRYLELDIFFPNEKIAIEYCGLYWHGSKRIESLYYNDLEELNYQLNKNKYRHQYKKLVCNSLGIMLFTIFEDEYLTKKDLVVSRIENKLGFATKVYARECDVTFIDKQTANDFLNSYHLQNSSTSYDFGVGLFYKNQMIAVMTYSKPLPKNNVHPDNLELKRYCCLPNTQILGGSAKMFKFSLNEMRKRGIPSIITYCDLRWGNGNVYKSLGFKLIKEMTKPSPHIIKGMCRSRSHNIENQNLIYDCGHQKWLFTISQLDNSQQSIQP